MTLKILGALLLIGVGIQFVPYGKDYTNPAIVAEPQWDSPKTKELFDRACANCHSHKTSWPWYSRVAPVSWLVRFDVDEGREHFNVSTWDTGTKNRGRDAAEEFSEGEMPPWIYVLGHPEAKLSEGERALFIQGLKATFNQ